MAAPTTNWVYDKPAGTEKDRAVAVQAKKIERKKIKAGYRWYKVNDRTRILVPFGQDGKPTKDGWRQINIFKEKCL